MMRYLTMAVLILGVVGLALGVVFIAQGQGVKTLVTERMVAEKITYSGEDFKTNSIIDTPEEAELMSQVLKEHRMDLGVYTELERDDPRRATILNAMTIENSLNLALLSYGIGTMVTVSGVFMVITGVALLGAGLTLHRLKGKLS